MEATRILVVDDEEDLCEILRFNLEIEGYEVRVQNGTHLAAGYGDRTYPHHLPDR